MLTHFCGDYMENKEKIRESNRKAVAKYAEKNNLCTMAIKITKEYKTKIELHYKNKGYTSANRYILDLIKKDME